MCNPCYLSRWREGTLPPVELTPTKLELWVVEMTGTPGCWPWIGYIDRNGYGMASVRWKRGNVPVGRAAWVLINGPVPDGMELDHRCHNDDLRCPGGRMCLHRACGNPGDLDLVTPSENCLRREERKRRMAALVA